MFGFFRPFCKIDLGKTYIPPAPPAAMPPPRNASILSALAQIVSKSETRSCDGNGVCNEVLSVRSQCGQISLSYECRSACRNCPDQVERLRQCSDDEWKANWRRCP